MNVYFYRKYIIRILFLIFLVLSFFTGISAATSKGIRFADEVTVDGQTLTLHGIGLLKWKYIVDVYLVALYKPKDLPIEEINANIPKRLEYYFFVDMEASDFQSTGFQLMARNIGEENAQSLIKELEAFNDLYRYVAKGQRYALTYMPGKGLEMALDGKPLGLVEGDEFGSAYLTIWLGPDPVSTSLQKGMFDPDTKKYYTIVLPGR